MALNEMQKRNLSKLDVMEGTGIFSKNTKVNSVEEPTVIISLGGLGGKTLNALKKQIMRRVNKEDNHIRLLAIDSDDKSLGQLDSLEQDEKLALYNPSIPNIIASPDMIPQYINKWKNPDFLPDLKGDGCRGVRQNGRFIISVPAVYQLLRSRIADAINDARRDATSTRVTVIFVAGISGGTGSGTFIDMAYLTQDVLLRDISIGTRNSFNMSAYLYMPDVQFDTPATNEALMSNGYASLKELDYFFNLDKVDGVYEWPFAEGAERNSSNNIYDFCTLVSSQNAGGAVQDREKTAINVTVESLMSIITDAKFFDAANQPVQLLSSFLDNHSNNVTIWMNERGADQGVFPRTANYKYNIVGFGSANIPVDAIMSYMALKMYENVLDEFNDMSGLNAAYISKLMSFAGVGDIDSIIEAVRNTAGYSYDSSTLPSGGDIRGLRQNYKNWVSKAIDHYSEQKTQLTFTRAIDKVTEEIIKKFDSKLEQAFDEHGPYFVIRTITASVAAYGIDGILRKIDALIADLDRELEQRHDLIRNTEYLHTILAKKAADIPANVLGVVSAAERDNYIAWAKRTIEKFSIELEILVQMQNKLVYVRNNLVTKNNNVFDVYTDVLDYIKDLLSNNSDLVVNSNRTRNNGGGTTYSLDVVNLDAAQENGKRLKLCLDSFLSPEFLAKFKDEFITMLRDKENRPAFTDNSEHFDATALIQSLFDKLLGEFYQEAIERFLIAYYTDSVNMNTYDELDRVMKNDAAKQAALTAAAEKICSKLITAGSPLCQIIAGDLDQFSPPQKYLCCPTKLYNIFRDVVNGFNQFAGVIICQRDHASSIDYVTNHIGIPLAKISGIAEDDVAYSRTIKQIKNKNNSGTHLNESVEADFDMLPAPFVYEVWKSVPGEHTSEIELENLAKVKALTDKLKSYGLLVINGGLKARCYFEDEISDELLSALSAKVDADVSVTNETDSVEYVRNFLSENGIIAGELPVIVKLSGIDETIENAEKIIRKNIIVFRKLNKFIGKLEKLIGIVEAGKSGVVMERVYNNNIVEFTNLIKTGMITYNNSARCWNYSDGMMEKPLYNFAIGGPFEVSYNLYFAFAAFILNVDTTVRESLKQIVMEKVQNQQINFDMPSEIKADIDKLFVATAPAPTDYLLDRELNRAKVNAGITQLASKFNDVPLPKYADYFDLLMKFYKSITANFN